MAAPQGPKPETVKLAKKAATVAGAKGKPLSAIAKKLGLSSGQARRAVELAREKGFVKKVGDSARSTVYAKA